jgi:beta-phosphoglucomutase-like phosphatase (HAD superfamily)
VTIRAVISDFGGVLTTPLLRSFVAFQDETGISFESLGKAMQSAAERDGAYPLFELEKGNLTEAQFLELLRDNLEPELGHRPELHGFRDIYFDALEPNEPLLTNNVREWEPLWRSMLPVDEIFELIVDSAFVGMRKPEPEIYELTLERLGGVEAGECVFVDDTDLNCDAARELGMTAVNFKDNEQAIAEIEAALDVP